VYLRPGDRVAVALEDPKNASKSTRALAVELGVSNISVSRARNKEGVRNLTPKAPIRGLDGKEYKPREVEPPRSIENWKPLRGSCRTPNVSARE
jgi:hypothetical protein